MKYYIKSFKNGEKVSTLATNKKMRLYPYLVRDDSSEWTLMVVYQKDVHNEGTFKTKEGVKTALKQWTEKPLLEYIEGGAW